MLVAHNGLIKVLLGRAIGCNALKPHLHSALTGITGIRVKPKGNVRVQFFNDTHHLTPELAAEEIAKRKVWIEDSATGRWTFGADKNRAEAVESA